MTSRFALEAAVERDMDRRIIRVDSLPDHAGIAAALRRAFAAGSSCDDLRPFDDLLKRLH
jgi:hypothetical protein